MTGQNLKRVQCLWGQSVIPRLALDIIYLRTKFGNYRFSRFGDMTAGIEIENGSHDPDYAFLEVVCHLYARILCSLPVYKI